MTRPRLEACWFGEGEQGDRYDRLARVFVHTVSRHCAAWDVRIERIQPPACVAASGNPSHAWNTQKLWHWAQRIAAAPDGAQVLLIDSDMMVLQPIDDVWRLDFDLAYTIRYGHGIPLNGGVVFVRVSPRTRQLVSTWSEVNDRFAANEREHLAWRAKYQGINQASFGYVLEHQVGESLGCRLLQLPCAEWNCCQWALFDPARSRIVHVKSRLRNTLFGLRSYAQRRFGASGQLEDQKIRQLIGVWHGLEREALAAAGLPAPRVDTRRRQPLVARGV